jgi:hypothetical protein
LLYIINSYALVVYIVSITDLNVYLKDLLDRILHLFYIYISTVSIEGFDFKESREDSYFSVNVAAILLKSQVNDKEIISTPAAVLLEPRASIIALYISSFNSFYISTKSGLNIKIRSILDLRNLKALEYP